MRTKKGVHSIECVLLLYNVLSYYRMCSLDPPGNVLLLPFPPYPDVPIAIWHLEETKLRSLLGLCSYELQANVTRKDLIVDNGYDEIVQEAISKITKDEMLFQFYLNDEDDPLLLLDQIRYLSQACGCKYIMFEPIQDVAASKNGDESKETFLADMAIRLSKLAAELNVGLITIAHTNDDVG